MYTLISHVDDVVRYYLLRRVSAACLNFLPCLNRTPTPAGCLKGKICEGSTLLKESQQSFESESVYISENYFFQEVTQYPMDGELLQVF